MTDTPDDAEKLAILLSEGLDLCARARKLDELESAEIACGNTCGTGPLWVLEQYDRDRADWEARAASALTEMGVGR